MTTAGARRGHRGAVALLPLVALVAALAVTAVIVVTVAGGIGADAHQTPTHAPDTSLVGPTLFGATIRNRPDLTPRAALRDTEQTLGRPQVLRLYDSGLPQPWAAVSGRSSSIPLVVSFKADPSAVLSGQYDTTLSTWFAAAPRDRPTYWAYFHEPEDQVASGRFTATEFRQAWQHIASLAATAHNPLLVSTIILMCWTVNPASGRDWRDYVTPGTVDVLAWDCYNHGAKEGFYQSPSTMLASALRASREASAGWGIAELGSLRVAGDNGEGRAAWLLRVGEFARQNGAAFVTYFDSSVGGDYRLDDSSSQQALRSLMANTPTRSVSYHPLPTTR